MASFRASAFKSNSGNWFIVPLEVEVKRDKVFYPERVIFKKKYYKLKCAKRRAIYHEETPMIEDKTTEPIEVNGEILDLHDKYIRELVLSSREMIGVIRVMNNKIMELETLCEKLGSEK